MNAAENLVQNLEAELAARKWSRVDLAQKSKIHVVTVSRILNRHQEPSLTVCEKMAAALEISLENLLAKKK